MVAALVVGASGTALSVPPPPVNPSDDEIAGAQAQVESGIGLVGTLINQVADADQQLARLDDEVATRREDVNKALVDLQAARSAADAAAAAVEASRAALRDAGAAIDLAQSDFDAYARSSYMHGTNVSSLSAYLGADGPDAVLDRAQVLQILSVSRGAVLDQLQRARTEEANRDSHARAAKADADAAAAEAENKRAAAEQAIATARAALDAQATRRAEIAASRAQAQEQLDSARASAAGLDGQRQAYRTWDEQRQAEEAAQAAAAAAARQAAEQAASRVAADAAARELAAQLAQTQNSHTDLDTYTPTPKTSTTKPTPTVTGSEAIETVVDRGMSQIGVEYAWGGGDENGPTKGIRDGGVADSYGDFDKIGFDCSGLMIYAFAGIGISLPHYTGYQYTAGEQVPSAEMRRGDMIFYGPNASQHVALYLGDGEMLEAPQSGSTVRVSPVRWEGMTPYAVRMVE
ncbi:NlpC/P60 family protein [Rhodococcus sp. HNM0569]|uniref:NlpC/P60 family protein n=1 Tax=Rhodococcus sp. HNM0569 TaxID=2716340 RepID=UPI00146BCAF2|nr:NlpC/P60 family protein [Rhodococcus sp. HNM0569]NLU81193.1 C40 family peptidase [Rhodococcus sp. HNM0569]